MEDDDNKTVNEPEVPYGYTGKRSIKFFSSFDEAELFGLREMAAHSYETRLENLETLRKRFLTSPASMPRVITIIKGVLQ
jgi:hypothetical protein